MKDLMRISKHHIPVEQVALIETYVAPMTSPLNTSRQFKTRIVLLNRDSVLSEQAMQEIATAYDFRVITTDDVATNPKLHFRVEDFVPAEGFNPAKAYRSRLLWRDQDGNTQSKLLLTEPEAVLAVAVRGASEVSETAAPKPERRTRRSAAARRLTGPNADPA